nr:PREDICTED: LOW QUALITY PROTEIN: WAS/WASL-interacting protein family member 1-like [Equus przewalskii]
MTGLLPNRRGHNNSPARRGRGADWGTGGYHSLHPRNTQIGAGVQEQAACHRHSPGCLRKRRPASEAPPAPRHRGGPALSPPRCIAQIFRKARSAVPSQAAPTPPERGLPEFSEGPPGPLQPGVGPWPPKAGRMRPRCVRGGLAFLLTGSPRLFPAVVLTSPLESSGGPPPSSRKRGRLSVNQPPPTSQLSPGRREWGSVHPQGKVGAKDSFSSSTSAGALQSTAHPE